MKNSLPKERCGALEPAIMLFPQMHFWPVEKKVAEVSELLLKRRKRKKARKRIETAAKEVFMQVKAELETF